MEFERGENFFGLSLLCSEREKNKEWSIDTKITLFITGSDGTSHSESLNGQFRNETEHRNFGLDNFISIERIENELLIKDEFILEIHVQVLSMSGIGEDIRLKCFDDDEAKKMSDVTLLVDGRRFYVSKLVLANQSTYFKSLFFGDLKESKESEITLENINGDAFQVFLEMIHLEETLTDSCVEDVLHLSDMYDARHVTRMCETFLFYDSALSTKKAIQIGIRFNLRDFTERCIKSLKSPAAVRAVMQSGDSLNEIKDPEVLRCLLEQLLSFN
ncbi:hypothetical protein CAEBREN_17723 [Caenorhabditis brenneri]|uniref:BTB domain-containing protein n=1 Tax=Caenorhabditis brenneri TaxID=135651 RepID=G0NYU1_CAEBE|nr:hypothetical protein CAEBREN_17723 [Caenorhabditis brenneri]